MIVVVHVDTIMTQEVRSTTFFTKVTNLTNLAI